MNYRQWKKSYKKAHGYNPPLADDRRKKAKRLTRLLLGLDISKVVEAVKEAYIQACDCISEGFRNLSESLRKE